MVTLYADASEYGTLLVTQAEPRGESCGLGGHRVSVGLDVNGDYALSEDEISDTQFVCMTTVVGSIRIETQEQLDAMSQVTHIEGDLELSNGITDLGPLSLVFRTLAVF